MSKQELKEMAKILGGTAVYAVIPGSISDKMGIQAGDILLSVNGMKTPTIDEYLVAAKLDADNYRTMVIWRNGEELNFKINTAESQLSEKEVAEAMEKLKVSEFLLSKDKEIGQA